MGDFKATSRTSVKPFTFALLGVIGALIGALVAGAVENKTEPLLVPTVEKMTGLKKGEKDIDVVTGMRVPGFTPEVQKRVDEAGGKPGDIQIALSWNNHNDLDLQCMDPNGERIYFTHRQSETRGELDVDRNNGPPYTDQPIEHIRWPELAPPRGHYQVYVNFYELHGGPNPTPYVCEIALRGQELVKKAGSINYTPREEGGKPELIYEFDYPPPAPPPGEVSAVAPPAVRLTNFVLPALMLGIWTAVLAVCLSAMLVIGQNHYLRRPLLQLRQLLVVVMCGTIAGMLAGAASQAIFSLVEQGPYMEQIGRIVGWVILGTLLGGGMALFIPNLSAKRAALAGGFGGLLGAIALIVAAPIFGPFPGQLAGAAILGFFIGLMVALVEELAREAWLVVHWNPHEVTQVSLGSKPVIIGSGKSAHIFLPRKLGFPTEMAAIRLNQGLIEYQEAATGRQQNLRNGSELKLGTIVIKVRSVR